MQNLSKRQWGHQLSIKQAADIAISWCIRAREKNVLRKKPPKIFYSYIFLLLFTILIQTETMIENYLYLI